MFLYELKFNNNFNMIKYNLRSYSFLGTWFSIVSHKTNTVRLLGEQLLLI